MQNFLAVHLENSRFWKLWECDREETKLPLKGSSEKSYCFSVRPTYTFTVDYAGSMCIGCSFASLLTDVVVVVVSSNLFRSSIIVPALYTKLKKLLTWKLQPCALILSGLWTVLVLDYVNFPSSSKNVICKDSNSLFWTCSEPHY